MNESDWKYHFHEDNDFDHLPILMLKTAFPTFWTLINQNKHEIMKFKKKKKKRNNYDCSQRLSLCLVITWKLLFNFWLMGEWHPPFSPEGKPWSCFFLPNSYGFRPNLSKLLVMISLIPKSLFIALVCDYCISNRVKTYDRNTNQILSYRSS